MDGWTIGSINKKDECPDEIHFALEWERRLEDEKLRSWEDWMNG